MKKYFKSYLAVWAVLLGLFNIIAFVSAGWDGQEKYTSSFWTGYIFILLAFGGNLFCSYKALQADNVKKMFYKLPMLNLAYSGLIASFIIGGLCMFISSLPYYVGVIACAVIFAVYVIAVIKADIASDVVQNSDKNVLRQTQFIKLITADAMSLKNSAASDSARANTNKVYEAFRYSDPMSEDSLSSIENDISEKFIQFGNLIKAGNDGSELADEVCRLVAERNIKCKVMK